MQIETSRFGTLAVEEEQIFRLPEGMIGFPDWTRYLLLNHSLLLPLDQPVAEIKALVVVNISKQQPPEIKANLLAPVLINSGKRIAKQVILYQTDYSVRHPVPTRN